MNRIFNKKNYFIVISIFIILIVIASLYDLQIANAINIGNNAFSTIFDAIGRIPATTASMVGASMVMASINKDKSLILAFKIISIVGPCVYSLYHTYETIYESLESLIAVGIVSIFLIFVFIFTYKKLSNYENKKLLFFIGLFLVSIVCGTSLVALIFKKIMARPRYNFIIDNPTLVSFKNWWQSSRDVKEVLVSQGIDSEMFKSLPSGHSVDSWCLTMLWLIPVFFTKKNNQLSLFIVGVIFGVLVMFSRMLCGAHFLSDVVFGAMITLVTQYICYIVYLKRFNE